MRPSTFLSLFFFGHMLFLDMPFSEFYQFLVGLFREAEPCQVSKNGGVNVTRYHCCYSRNHQGRQGTCISKYPHHYQILLILSFYPYKRTRVKLYIRLNFWSFLWNIDVFFIFIVLNFELLFSVFMHSRIVQNRISLVRGVWGGGDGPCISLIESGPLLDRCHWESSADQYFPKTYKNTEGVSINAYGGLIMAIRWKFSSSIT